MDAHEKYMQAPYEQAAIDHEALQARIAAEADAIMAECANVKAAQEFSDDHEALLDDRTMMIAFTCSILLEKGMNMDEKHTALGELLIHKVRAAAIKRATFSVTEG